jgi:hypothetical protein
MRGSIQIRPAGVSTAHPGRGMQDIVSIKFLVISPDVYLG